MDILHQPNDIIDNRYRIVVPLGQGGSGTTYEAEDLTTCQRVAIKVIGLQQVEDWKILELFEREAKVLETLNHPGIPNYLNYFHTDTVTNRRFYLVQELVAGLSLADWVKQGWHADEFKVKEIAIKILEILNYLHCLHPPVIHRDIKPHNILLCHDGRVFLVDFGAVQEVYHKTLIRGGTFVGTLGYMPLEQMRGQAFFASDLYALGATLVFLLTHRVPADLPQIRMKLDFRSRVQISPEFADWLEKMLEPAIEDRFKSAAEALKALQSNLAIAPTFHDLPPVRRQPKGSRLILRKTSEQFLLENPPVGFNTGTLVLGIFSLVWSFFAFQLTLPLLGFLFQGLILMSFNFPALFLSGLLIIPVWLVSLGTLAGCLYTIDGRVYLEVNRKNFYVGIKCFSWSWQTSGPTNTIDKIELEVNSFNQGQKTTQLAIVAGGIKRYFGWWMTPPEKEWVMAELSDFLKKIGQLRG